MSSSLPVSRRWLPSALAVALTIAACLGLAGPAVAQEDDGPTDPDPTGDRVVEILPIDGLLDPPVVGAITEVIATAEERGSELVVIQLDSGGGVSADVDALVTAMRDATVPVAVFIGPLGVAAEARGAAALVLAAAPLRVVAPDATVGPAVPANLGEAAADEATTLTALWPTLGPNAEAVVAGPVEAMTLQETGAVDLVAAGLQPLLVELDGTTVATAAGATTLRIRADEVSVRFHSLGLVRRVLHAATTPVFIYLLLTVGLGLLLFELFQPGFGVAGMAGVVTVAIGGFGLTVLPIHWWAAALVILGLVLYAVDTAIAGFGPVTLAATAAFASGSAFLYDDPALGVPGFVIAGTTVTALVFFVFVMTTILRAQAGPEGVDLDDLVGRPGIVRSVLNPEGHVFIDDALWRARWTGEAKRAKVGTPVQVHGVDGPVLLVEAFEAAAAVSGPVTDGFAES